MEVIIFYSFFSIVFGILALCFYVKMWGMANNAVKIRKILEEFQLKQQQQNESPKMSLGDIPVGALVVNVKTQDQMKVTAIENGKYECCKAGSTTSAGTFSREEIELFDTYWKNQK